MASWSSVVAIAAPPDKQEKGSIAPPGKLHLFIHHRGLNLADVVEASFPLSGCTALQRKQLEKAAPHVLWAQLDIEDGANKLWLAVNDKDAKLVEMEVVLPHFGSSILFLGQVHSETHHLYADFAAALFAQEGKAFFRSHALLLRSLRQLPEPEAALQSLLAIYKGGGEDSRKVILWAAAEQVLAAAEAADSSAAGAVAELARWPSLAGDAVAAWVASEPADGEPLAAVKRALQRVLTADVKAVIPTFHTVRFASLLHKVGVIPEDASAIQLQPSSPPPMGPAPDTSAKLVNMLPTAMPKIQRSKTLVERDADWERAAKAAVRTVGRYHAAQQQLEEQTEWAEELLTACHGQLGLVPGGAPSDALDALAEARRGAAKALQSVSDAVTWAQRNGIEKKMRDMAERGQELRQRTHQLVSRFGADVGSYFESQAGNSIKACFVSTAAGFHPEPTVGGVDGAPFDNKSAPMHSLSGPRSVVYLGGTRWLFSETGSSRLRLFDSHTDSIMTQIGITGQNGHADGGIYEALVKHPSGLAKINDDVLVADTGNHCLRLLQMPPDNGPPQITTLGGTRRGYKDGSLRVAEFRDPTSLVVAGLDVVVAEPGALRIVSGLVEGRAAAQCTVAPLCGNPARPGFQDGMGPQAQVTAPAGMATAPWSSRLVFFTDRNVIRAVNLKSMQVTTVAGCPTGPGAYKDGAPNEAKFNGPTGLLFLPDESRTLIVADTQNHLLRAVKFSPKGAVEKVETIAGKPGKANWRDGDGGYALLHSPTGLACTPTGAILVSEIQGHRLRWLWPPTMRAHATQAYMQLREPGHKLTSDLLELVKDCNLGFTVAEALQEARASVLDGQAAAVAAVYRHSVREAFKVVAALPPADAETAFAVLSGLAPTAELLSETLAQARSREVAGSMEIGRRAVLARLEAVVAAGEAAASKEEEEPEEEGKKIREGQLQGWIELATANPAVFDLEVLGMLLRGYSGAPNMSLLRLCALSIPAGDGGRALQEVFGPLRECVRVAMEAHTRTTMSEKEKFTQEKMLKVALQHWTHVGSLAELAGENQLSDISRALLQCGLDAICAEGCEGACSSLLSGICKGLSIWLGKVDSVSGAFQPFRPDARIYDIVRATGKLSCAHLGTARSLRDLLRRAKDKEKDAKGTEEPETKAKESGPSAEDLEDSIDITLLYNIIAVALPEPPSEEAGAIPWLENDTPWTTFLQWSVQEAPRVARLMLQEPFQPLQHLMGRISQVLETSTAEMEEGTALIGSVNFLEKQAAALQPVLSSVRLTSRFTTALKACTAELREFRTDLMAIEAACEGRLASNEAPMRGLEVLRAEMQHFRIKEVRAFFGVGLAADASANLAPLPPLLVKATAWLRAHSSSKAFGTVWAAACEAEPEDVEARLRRCIEEWGSLLARLMDGSLSFGELEQYAEAFAQESELSLFARSASAVQSAGKEGFKFAPPPRLAARVVNDRCQLVATMFNLLVRARHQAKGMENTVMLLAKFVVASTPTVQEALESIRGLCQNVEALEDWAGTRVEELSKFAPLLERIDQRLYSLDDSFLAALQERSDFLGWLAETFPPPDQNFTSAVEMAMGRPEMECPPELWVERTADRPGHPDEQKLSMLTSVRQALHRYLYRQDGSDFGSFANLTEAVDCLAGVVGPIAPLTSSLHACAELHLAFAELLADDAQERGATGRLLNLQRPDWHAEWRFRVVGAEAQLELAYQIPRKGRSIAASQTLGEVLDFQSSVVLSRGHGNIAAAVDHFVASFGWAQELAKAYTALVAVGHFAYLGHESSVLLISPPQELQAKADKLQAEKKKWSAFVSDLRTEVPALNWFTMRQLQLLLPVLRDGETSARPECSSLLAGVLQSSEEAEAVLQKLSGSGSSGPAGAFEELRLLADGLSAALPNVVRLRRTRPGARSLTMSLEAGISICASARPLQLALTAFMQLGALPEWPLMLLCQPSTSWEEVCNLLHRWATFDAPHRLFCLCCVDALPSNVSQELAAWLMRRSSEPTSSALLLICQVAEHPLMRQLAAFRTVMLPATVEELRSLGAALDSHFSCGAAVLSSSVPGAGKTFRAHTHAARRRAERVHIPLHKSVGVPELLSRHGAKLAEPGPKMLHLDIVGSADAAHADACLEHFEPLLLELLLLGGFHDAISGKRWAWEPQGTSLCVEVPAAASTIERSAVLSVLPNVHVVPSAADFCVTRDELWSLRALFPPQPEEGGCAFEHGPGSPGQDSEESGKADSPRFKEGAPSSEDRSCIQLVCQALEEYQEKQGRYSTSVLFNNRGNALSGQDCFRLLCKTVGRRLGTREPSLTGLLAFVRIVHWQLREFWLAFPKGLRVAGRQEGPEHPELHGEILAFICRTAADFSFRQERMAPEDRQGEWLKFSHKMYAGGLHVGTKVEWLQRTFFESNGEPVFRAGTWLDPTYVHCRDRFWVQESGVKPTGDFSLRSQDQRLEGRWAAPGSENATDAQVVSHSAALQECPDLANRDEEKALATGEPGGLTAWDEANHEVLLVSGRVKALSFLARDTKLLKRHIHPELQYFLEKAGFQVGEELHKSSVHPMILSRITGVERDATEAASLLPGGFCLTGDGLLKLLAVYVRARCGVPVLLQGECGTGKTHMLRYLCKWLRAELCVLDVHGGTTEEDIEETFNEATKKLATGAQKEIFVFLDEVNTCAHMDLICEAMCSRSLHGKAIDGRIRVLAAANPYRKRTKQMEAPGLTYKLHNDAGGVVDPLQDLVYRVHPLPPSLREFLFDFGGLPPEAELQYVKSMAAATFPEAEAAVRAVISRLMQRAQAFVRQAEGDHSAVSLRDVQRSFKLARWFQKFGAGGKVHGRHPLSAPVVLGLAHVFYFRLPTDELRSDIMRQLRLEVTQLDDAATTNFEWLKPPGVMEKVIASTQKGLCSKLVVEEGIAMNTALMENLYVTLVCICNREPVFVIGKPGSSKTLTMQVLASNLQGEQSQSAFWRRFPSIYVFSYQCSPFSTALGIKHQYEIACNYQRKAQHTMTVLLLDEVGLAEHSPDMPLKVLHGILVKPKVAIVGLSNWTLDAAKMNRTVCLQRPSPTPSDIHLTGVHLLGPEQATPEPPAPAAGQESAPPGPPPLQRSRSGASGTPSWLEPLSRAYHAVYTRQKGRDFLGMRDYYQMVHLLWRELILKKHQAAPNRLFSQELLCRALCRNFGGREDLLLGALETFGKECFGTSLPRSLVPPIETLVRESLSDSKARHVMLLTSCGAALPLTFSREMVPKATPVLVGSAFPEDRHNLYLIQHVNRVKAAMAAGETVILWNLDNIYESLYDVLNQRYVVRTSGGKTRRSLRLAIGARSQLCPVEEGFRLIVIVEKEHAYQDLDLPLLNRFEKFVMEPRNLLSQKQLDVAAQLNEWMTSILGESSLQDSSAAFSGLHAGVTESLTLAEAPAKGERDSADSSMLLRSRERLAALATPFAVMRSPTLQAAAPDYGESQGSLEALSERLGSPLGGKAPFVLVLTQTPLILLNGPWTTVRLSDIPSEARLISIFDKFYNAEAEESTLLVQCDPQLTPQFMIDHSRLLVERSAANSTFAGQRRCLFLVHMPSSHRVRHYAVNFHGRWDFYFVDEARPRTEVALLSGVSTLDLLQKPLHELARGGATDLQPVMSQRLQPAMAVIAAQGSLPLQDRTVALKSTLEKEPRFAELLQGLMLRSLESLATSSGNMQVPFHVELALGQLSAGSLSMSLNVAVDALVTRALANALMVLDVNSGLDLLIGLGHQEASSEARAAWLALSEVLLDSTAVTTCRFEGLFTGRGTPTRNLGTYGHLQARFPFSHRLQSQLKAAWDVLDAKVASEAGEKDWDAWCVTQLGEQVWRAAGALRDPVSGCHLGYLHDVVLGGGALALPGLEGPEQYELHKCLLSRSCPEALKSLPGIHWAIQRNEALILGLGAALALLPQEEQRKVLAAGSSERSILEAVESCCWTRLCVLAAKGDARTFAARLTAAAEDLAPLSLVDGGLWLALRVAATAAAHKPVADEMLASLQGAGAKQKGAILAVASKAVRAGDATLLAIALRTLQNEPGARDDIVSLAVDALATKACPDVQRALVALLCACGKEEEALKRALGVDVLQLLLAYMEEAEVVQGQFSEHLPDKPNSAEDLRNIARSRRACEVEIEALLSESDLMCQARDRREKFALPPRTIPQQAKTPTTLANYGLTYAHTRHGLPGIVKLLVLPSERVAWLGVATSKADLQELHQVKEGSVSCDPFASLFGEHYTEALGGLRLSCPQGAEAAEFLESSSSPAVAAAAALLMKRLTAEREQYRRPSLEGELDFRLKLRLERWAASPKAMLQLRWMQGACSGPYSQQSGLSQAVRQHSRQILAEPSVAQGLFSLTFHVVGLAAASPENGFLRKAILEPEALKAMYLPGMPWDEHQMVYKAMKAERVTWYRCPKGHLYSVGECGGPVMTSRCSHPGCGRIIGGLNHNVSAGNQRMGTFYEMHRDRVSTLSGYPLEGNYSTCGYQVARNDYNLPRESTCVHRLVLHLLLVAGAEIFGEDHPTKLMKGLNLRQVVSRLEADFQMLHELLAWQPGELVLGLHHVLANLEPMLASLDCTLQSPADCERFETMVDDGAIRPVLMAPGSRRAIVLEAKKQQISATESLARRVLGEERWLALQEEKAPGGMGEVPRSLWRFRKRATFQDMVASFEALGAEASKRPLLRAFLHNEDRLPLIGMLQDILAWHRLLFSALGPVPLTREEAAQRTNEDVIESMPESEHEAAIEVLERFCLAFNRTLPKLKNLFECQRNPFLDDEGNVDLAMGGEEKPVEMGFETPLHFSLPSHPPGILADAPGLCTIQILNLLVRIHNEVCQEIAAVSGQNRRQGPAAVDVAAGALTVSASTPPDLLGRRLISYSRQRDLSPLLFEFSQQSLEYGEGGDLGYNFEGLEAAIADRVLAGKRPLALQVRHYMYAGESRTRGGLAALQQVMPQSPSLPPAMAAALPGELDTREQTVRFLGLLEEAIHFIVAVGAQPAGERETLLAVYLRDVVLVSKDRLVGGLPSSVEQQATLRHLRALFLFAEDRVLRSAQGGGNAALLPSVQAAYRSPLPEEVRGALTTACARCQEMEAVVPVLHDLLTGVLSDGATTFSAGESLLEFLVYEDVSLDEKPWFRKNFPPDLCLGHAVEAFRTMTSLLTAPAL